MANFCPLDVFVSTSVSKLKPLESWESLFSKYISKSKKLKTKQQKFTLKKTRRGLKSKKKLNSSKKQNFVLLGNNVDGLRNKMESLEQNIRVFSPTVITLKETN